MKNELRRLKMSKDKAKISNGGYAEMIKERKAIYPEHRQTVDEILSKWDGGLLCVMRVDEDENGDPSGVQVFVGGVSKVANTLALAETMANTAESLLKRVKKSAMEDLAKEIAGDDDMKEIMKMLIDIIGDKK